MSSYRIKFLKGKVIEIASHHLRDLFKQLYPDITIHQFHNANLSQFFPKPSGWGPSWYREEIDLFFASEERRDYDGKRFIAPLHAIVSLKNNTNGKGEFLATKGCSYHTLNLKTLESDLESLIFEIRRAASKPDSQEKSITMLRREETDFIFDLSKAIDSSTFELFPQASLRNLLIPSEPEKQKLDELKRKLNSNLRDEANTVHELDPIGDILKTTSVDVLIATAGQVSLPLLAVEIDGSVHYPDLQESDSKKAVALRKQYKDKIKNRIFRNSGIPLIRFQFLPESASTVAPEEQINNELQRTFPRLALASATAVVSVQTAPGRMVDVCMSMLEGYIEENLSYPLSDDLKKLSKILSRAIAEDRASYQRESDTENSSHEQLEEDGRLYYHANWHNEAADVLAKLKLKPSSLFSCRCLIEGHPQDPTYSQVILRLTPNSILMDVGIEPIEVAFPDKFGFKVISNQLDVKKTVELAIYTELSEALKAAMEEQIFTQGFIDDISARVARRLEDS